MTARCALEELNLWLVEQGLPPDAREWLLAWANLRAENVLAFAIEVIRAIATGCEQPQFVAQQFLRSQRLEE